MLDELAAEFGGISQYTAEETIAMLASQEASGADEPAAELPIVEPVPLPESLIAAGAQTGQSWETTADLTPGVMAGIANLAPQLLTELEPAMWRAIDPAAVAVVIGDLEEQIDPILLAELLATIVNTHP